MTLYDYAGPGRGHWARLRDTSGKREVIVTDYPTTLIQMLRSGNLTGHALKDAKEAARHVPSGE